MDILKPYKGYATPDLDVALITSFCSFPKGLSTLEKADAWVIFTGTGYRIPAYVLDKRRTTRSHQPILIIGPDNLLLAEKGKETTAAHFRQWLIDQGVPAAEIIATDDLGMYTPAQAQCLFGFVQENHWKNIILFTPWFHTLRAWLTVLGQLKITGLDPASIRIIPEPAGNLSFDEPNLELTGGKTAWDLRWCDELPRIQKYQNEKDPPDVAKWSTAVDYLLLHGLIK